MTATSLTPLHVLDARSLAIARIDGITDRHWPGVLSTAVVLSGERCALEWSDVKAVLRERVGLVDGVVFVGAEPTAQPALADAAAQSRELGYRVGLRTSGAYPHRLAEVLPLVDWVGLEVMDATPVLAWTSLELVMRSGVQYEVTLTVDPARHSRQDVHDAAREVIRRGGHAPVLQGRRLYEVIGLEDLPDLERR